MTERITGKSNPKIRWAAHLMASARFRRECGLWALEGLRLCRDALHSGCEIMAVFFTADIAARHETDLAALSAAAGEAYEVTPVLFARMADTKTPQGVLCICRPPQWNWDTQGLPANGRYLVMEDVADPRNLGASARTAEALGLTGLVLSGGCDESSPKAQRAAMGSLLRLPILRTDHLLSLLKSLPEQGILTYAAVPHGEALPVTACNFSTGCAVVVGNEANGLRPETIAGCSHRVTIPLVGRSESLNAAAAATILMWEMLR